MTTEHIICNRFKYKMSNTAIFIKTSVTIVSSSRAISVGFSHTDNTVFEILAENSYHIRHFVETTDKRLVFLRVNSDIFKTPIIEVHCNILPSSMILYYFSFFMPTRYSRLFQLIDYVINIIHSDSRQSDIINTIFLNQNYFRFTDF